MRREQLSNVCLCQRSWQSYSYVGGWAFAARLWLRVSEVWLGPVPRRTLDVDRRPMTITGHLNLGFGASPFAKCRCWRSCGAVIGRNPILEISSYAVPASQTHRHVVGSYNGNLVNGLDNVAFTSHLGSSTADDTLATPAAVRMVSSSSERQHRERCNLMHRESEMTSPAPRHARR